MRTRVDTSVFIILGCAASCLDSVTTWFGVSGGAQEMNPIARAVMGQLGLFWALVLRALIGVILFLFAGWKYQKWSQGRQRRLRRTVKWTSLGTAFVVLNNFLALVLSREER